MGGLSPLPARGSSTASRVTHRGIILRDVSRDQHGEIQRNREEAELVRNTERERLIALVRGDVEHARQLHADDLQLITPEGEVLSKEQYLAAIASGDLNYIVFEPGAIVVRMYGDAAIIRYQSEIEIIVRGDTFPRHPLWHTDSYERRDGRWQVVWSQATEIE
jgi:hypothetical protein